MSDGEGENQAWGQTGTKPETVTVLKPGTVVFVAVTSSTLFSKVLRTSIAKAYVKANGEVWYVIHGYDYDVMEDRLCFTADEAFAV